MNLERHRRLIERIVDHYVEAEVVLVPDVAEWTAEKCGGYWHADSTNPIGRALWNSPVGEPNRVILRSPLSTHVIQNHLFALYMAGFRRVYYKIESNFSFLKHLALHEVAHIRHNWHQDHEKDCDRWAFKELPKWG